MSNIQKENMTLEKASEFHDRLTDIFIEITGFSKGPENTKNFHELMMAMSRAARFASRVAVDCSKEK